tara:strand:+ start:383 stop:844 length:462 start_codon:yes stop_codon:yes gene_type:complete
MTIPQFKHLFDITLDIGNSHDLGSTPQGKKRIVQVTGGKFFGDRASGHVRSEAAADWVLVRPDKSIKLDVRLTLETSDRALIFMRYEGIRHSSPAIASKLANNEPIDPSLYYWRASPFFETSNHNYLWINNIVSIALGQKKENKVFYEVFQVL